MMNPKVCVLHAVVVVVLRGSSIFIFYHGLVIFTTLLFHSCVP